MASFLEGPLAETIFNEMGTAVFYEISFIPLTLTDDGSGGKTKADGATVAARGFVDEYSDFHRANGKIPVGDRKIWISQLGEMTGLEPQINDKIIARGETYLIVNKGQDPAGALWELQARPI